MTYGQKPTMEDTYNLLKSSNFLVGRANGKTIIFNHVANIVYAISRQIAKEAIIRKSRGDLKIGGTIFRKNATICECPICKNYVRHGQRYCDNCGQALQYDY